MSEAPNDATREAFEAFSKPDVLLRVPMGFASPLWGLFAGAAFSGSAWWWMTRFARIENVEAMFGAAEAQAVKAATLPLPAVEAVVGAAIETLDAVEVAVEAVTEPIVETAIEADAGSAAAEPDDVLAEAPLVSVAEAMAAVEDLPEPVGGESGPISPLLATMTPEPEAETFVRPKRKSSPPKATD